METTVTIKLTSKEVDYLRGVLYEYYRTNQIPYQDDDERLLHQQLEDILANAEESFCS